MVFFVFILIFFVGLFLFFYMMALTLTLRLKKVIVPFYQTFFYSLIVLLFWQNPLAEAKLQKKEFIRIDGSSTVYLLTEAVVEEFGAVKENKNVRLTVAVSGTGGGFKKFLNKEVDINNASRQMKPSEIILAKEKNIKYMSLDVAYDGITIVVNPKNDWIGKGLTADQLKEIWKPESKINNWNDINSQWPAKPIKLYGPGPDSGTFDYFTESINGKSGRCRDDYTMSEDDNMLVRGVAGDKYALGFFGFAYYQANSNKLKAVPISQNGSVFVLPTVDTISQLKYKPLARSLFIYVNKSSLNNNPSLSRFIHFYLNQAGALAQEVGYIGIPENVGKKTLQKYKQWSKASSSIKN